MGKKPKHIATYAVYGYYGVKRLGTGYLYSMDDIKRERSRHRSDYHFTCVGGMKIAA